MAEKKMPRFVGCFCAAILAGCQLALGEPLNVSDLPGSNATNLPTAEVAQATTQQDVNQATQLFSRGDYAGALAKLQAAKKATPELPPAETIMAQLYFSTGQTAAGNAQLEKSLKVTPDDPEALIILTERAAGENRLTEAELLVPKAEQLLGSFQDNSRRKTNLQARLLLVGAALDETHERYEAAQKKLEALIKIEDKNAAAHQRLGRVLNAQGGSEAQKKALAEFKRAAELDPKALPAELMMAMLSKDPAQTDRWIQFAIKNHPDDLRTQLGAADYHLKGGRLDKAREHAETAIKIDPTGFDANLLAGLVDNLSGDYPKAIEYLSRAHLLQPSNPNVVGQLTLALLESPNPADQARAVSFAEMNARMQPDKIEPQAALGWAYFRQKRMADAERAFKAVFNRPAGTPLNVNGDTSYILAALAATQGNTQDAVRMLEPVLAGTQLFVYRPKAEDLLAKLTQNSGSGGAGTK